MPVPGASKTAAFPVSAAGSRGPRGRPAVELRGLAGELARPASRRPRSSAPGRVQLLPGGSLTDQRPTYQPELGPAAVPRRAASCHRRCHSLSPSLFNSSRAPVEQNPGAQVVGRAAAAVDSAGSTIFACRATTAASPAKVGGRPRPLAALVTCTAPAPARCAPHGLATTGGPRRGIISAGAPAAANTSTAWRSVALTGFFSSSGPRTPCSAVRWSGGPACLLHRAGGGLRADVRSNRLARKSLRPSQPVRRSGAITPVPAGSSSPGQLERHWTPSAASWPQC